MWPRCSASNLPSATTGRAGATASWPCADGGDPRGVCWRLVPQGGREPLAAQVLSAATTCIRTQMHQSAWRCAALRRSALSPGSGVRHVCGVHRSTKPPCAAGINAGMACATAAAAASEGAASGAARAMAEKRRRRLEEDEGVTRFCSAMQFVGNVCLVQTALCRRARTQGDLCSASMPPCVGLESRVSCM